MSNEGRCQQLLGFLSPPLEEFSSVLPYANLLSCSNFVESVSSCTQLQPLSDSAMLTPASCSKCDTLLQRKGAISTSTDVTYSGSLSAAAYYGLFRNDESRRDFDVKTVSEASHDLCHLSLVSNHSAGACTTGESDQAPLFETNGVDSTPKLHWKAAVPAPLSHAIISEVLSLSKEEGNMESNAIATVLRPLVNDNLVLQYQKRTGDSAKGTEVCPEPNSLISSIENNFFTFVQDIHRDNTDELRCPSDEASLLEKLNSIFGTDSTTASEVCSCPFSSCEIVHLRVNEEERPSSGFVQLSSVVTVYDVIWRRVIDALYALGNNYSDEGESRSHDGNKGVVFLISGFSALLFNDNYEGETFRRRAAEQFAEFFTTLFGLSSLLFHLFLYSAPLGQVLRGANFDSGNDLSISLMKRLCQGGFFIRFVFALPPSEAPMSRCLQYLLAKHSREKLHVSTGLVNQFTSCNLPNSTVSRTCGEITVPRQVPGDVIPLSCVQEAIDLVVEHAGDIYNNYVDEMIAGEASENDLKLMRVSLIILPDGFGDNSFVGRMLLSQLSEFYASPSIRVLAGLEALKGHFEKAKLSNPIDDVESEPPITFLALGQQEVMTAAVLDSSWDFIREKCCFSGEVFHTGFRAVGKQAFVMESSYMIASISQRAVRWIFKDKIVGHLDRAAVQGIDDETRCGKQKTEVLCPDIKTDCFEELFVEKDEILQRLGLIRDGNMRDEFTRGFGWATEHYLCCSGNDSEDTNGYFKDNKVLEKNSFKLPCDFSNSKEFVLHMTNVLLAWSRRFRCADGKSNCHDPEPLVSSPRVPSESPNRSSSAVLNTDFSMLHTVPVISTVSSLVSNISEMRYTGVAKDIASNDAAFRLLVARDSVLKSVKKTKTELRVAHALEKLFKADKRTDNNMVLSPVEPGSSGEEEELESINDSKERGNNSEYFIELIHKGGVVSKEIFVQKDNRSGRGEAQDRGYGTDTKKKIVTTKLIHMDLINPSQDFGEPIRNSASNDLALHVVLSVDESLTSLPALRWLGSVLHYSASAGIIHVVTVLERTETLLSNISWQSRADGSPSKSRFGLPTEKTINGDLEGAHLSLKSGNYGCVNKSIFVTLCLTPLGRRLSIPLRYSACASRIGNDTPFSRHVPKVLAAPLARFVLLALSLSFPLDIVVKKLVEMLKVLCRNSKISVVDESSICSNIADSISQLTAMPLSRTDVSHYFSIRTDENLEAKNNSESIGLEYLIKLAQSVANTPVMFLFESVEKPPSVFITLLASRFVCIRPLLTPRFSQFIRRSIMNTLNVIVSPEFGGAQVQEVAPLSRGWLTEASPIVDKRPGYAGISAEEGMTDVALQAEALRMKSIVSQLAPMEGRKTAEFSNQLIYTEVKRKRQKRRAKSTTENDVASRIFNRGANRRRRTPAGHADDGDFSEGDDAARSAQMSALLAGAAPVQTILGPAISFGSWRSQHGTRGSVAAGIEYLVSVNDTKSILTTLADKVMPLSTNSLRIAVLRQPSVVLPLVRVVRLEDPFSIVGSSSEMKQSVLEISLPAPLVEALVVLRLALLNCLNGLCILLEQEVFNVPFGERDQEGAEGCASDLPHLLMERLLEADASKQQRKKGKSLIDRMVATSVGMHTETEIEADSVKLLYSVVSGIPANTHGSKENELDKLFAVKCLPQALLNDQNFEKGLSALLGAALTPGTGLGIWVDEISARLPKATLPEIDLGVYQTNKPSHAELLNINTVAGETKVSYSQEFAHLLIQ